MLTSKDLLPEISFSTSRSSGPGGQNVNKVNTRITLKWDVQNSVLISNAQREKILKKLASRISKEGILQLSEQSNRSQLKNKEAVLKKFDELIRKALMRRKRRLTSKPKKSAIEKRLKEKRELKEKKDRRRSDKI